MPPVVDGKHERVERRLARIIIQYKRVKRPKTNSLASRHCTLSAIHKIGRTGGLCCSHRPPLNPTCSCSPPLSGARFFPFSEHAPPSFVIHARPSCMAYACSNSHRRPRSPHMHVIAE